MARPTKPFFRKQELGQWSPNFSWQKSRYRAQKTLCFDGGLVSLLGCDHDYLRAFPNVFGLVREKPKERHLRPSLAIPKVLHWGDRKTSASCPTQGLSRYKMGRKLRRRLNHLKRRGENGTANAQLVGGTRLHFRQSCEKYETSQM